MIKITSSATEYSTCAYGELSMGESVALKMALRQALEKEYNSFMKGELSRALAKLEVIEKEADQDERYIGFTVGTKRPEIEFNFDDD